MIGSAQIRRDFLRFFEERAHQVVPSSPVVPKDDPTLLFANAGMNQFKDVFLGQGERAYPRAASTQKCLRVSGKHNDLEEVGRDTYHHTLFEMLGNWSFGDYYKREAIRWAWELLTGVWGLPKDKLYVTVFAGDEHVPFDAEADEMWRTETDIQPDHILRFGHKDNFWEMGESGPCGPCTEIHIDRGEAFGEQSESCFVNTGHARYIELWNLVFIQYNREPDGTLVPLPKRHVDTGAGFERLCAVLQGVASNYDTDVFQPLIQAVARLSGVPYSEAGGTPHRVIADHLRALAFAVADGATPSNEGRGYVLRRILRRAARFGRELGLREPFLGPLCRDLAESSLGEAFPELRGKLGHIQHVLTLEEESFGRTLDRGLERFAQLHATLVKAGQAVIPGDEAFRLYDTYGFPLDLTQQMAAEQGLSVDEEGFTREMERQREASRGARKQTAYKERAPWNVLSSDSSVFLGYDLLETMTRVLRWRAGEEGELELVLEKTPFYAESGGQTGDRGLIEGEAWSLVVGETRLEEELRVHVGQVRGTFNPTDLVSARVEPDLRRATERNHSATHLLQAALRQVLGGHVNQEGSLVEPGRLRFDFSHPARLEESELERVEKLVFEQILRDEPVSCRETSHERALAEGVTALFGEKYGDVVRVVRMGEFSAELCGGTHVARTGQIGAFSILSEGSVAAGIRRIEAVTGLQAQQLMQQQRRTLDSLRDLLGARGSDELEALEKTLSEKKDLQRELRRLKEQLALNNLREQLAAAESPAGIRLLAVRDDEAEFELLKGRAELLQGKETGFAALLVSGFDNKVSFAISLSAEAVQQGWNANALVKELAPLVDGKGGGRPNLATGGGKNVAGIDGMIQAWKRRR
ncbi:MAG: alanine--tRNA ligase [Candidatus Delongbacteria bacterium]